MATFFGNAFVVRAFSVQPGGWDGIGKLGGGVLLCFACLLNGCAAPAVIPDNGGRINHVVLVWLKDHGNREARRAVMAATRELRRIPGLLALRVGEVRESERPIVDDSFDIGVIMVFASAVDMQHYTQDFRHQRIVRDRIRPLAKKITVYDFTSTF